MKAAPRHRASAPTQVDRFYTIATTASNQGSAHVTHQRLTQEEKYTQTYAKKHTHTHITNGCKEHVHSDVHGTDAEKFWT